MAIQLRHLRYFAQIVEAGSFSRAASIGRIAQPALSQQIADLEAELGVQLLVRSARGVRPTEAGLVFYREARSVLRQVEQIPALLRATDREPAGAVSIGLPRTIAARIVPGFVARCRERYPRVLLRIVEGSSAQLRDSLAASRVDLSLVYEELQVPGLVRQPLFRQALSVIGLAGAWASAGPMPLADLAGLDLVLPSSPNAVRDRLQEALAAAGLAPRVVAELNSFHSLLDAVRAGLGVSVLPWPAAAAGLETTGFVARRIEPSIELTVSMVASALAPISGAAHAVGDLLAAFMAHLVRDGAWPGAAWVGSHRPPL